MGYVGATVAIGSIAGPVLGGFLVDTLGWQYIFLINVPIGAVLIPVAMRYFGSDGPATERYPDGLDRCSDHGHLHGILDACPVIHCSGPRGYPAGRGIHRYFPGFVYYSSFSRSEGCQIPCWTFQFSAFLHSACQSLPLRYISSLSSW